MNTPPNKFQWKFKWPFGIYLEMKFGEPGEIWSDESADFFVCESECLAAIATEK